MEEYIKYVVDYKIGSKDCTTDVIDWAAQQVDYLPSHQCTIYSMINDTNSVIVKQDKELYLNSFTIYLIMCIKYATASIMFVLNE